MPTVRPTTGGLETLPGCRDTVTVDLDAGARWVRWECSVVPRDYGGYQIEVPASASPTGLPIAAIRVEVAQSVEGVEWSERAVGVTDGTELVPEPGVALGLLAGVLWIRWLKSARSRTGFHVAARL